MSGETKSAEKRYLILAVILSVSVRGFTVICYICNQPLLVHIIQLATPEIEAFTYKIGDKSGEEKPLLIEISSFGLVEPAWLGTKFRLLTGIISDL